MSASVDPHEAERQLRDEPPTVGPVRVGERVELEASGEATDAEVRAAIEEAER